MAPEVFAGDVCPRSDIWAMGVVIYELLCGERPFVAENAMAMYMRIRSTEVSLAPVRDAGVGGAAAAFISRLLAKAPQDRPAAAEALKDPWLSDRSKSPGLPNGRMARKVRRSLEGFAAMDHFARAAMNCVAAQLDTGKVEGLSEIFESLDADHDGKLSAAELAVGLAELGVSPDSIGHLVDVLDLDSNLSIQYSEFVASLLSTQGQLVEDVLYHAFHIIDINHDGVVSIDELRLMLSGGGPLAAVLPDGKTVEQVLAEVDTSKDGVISFEEFKAYLTREDPEATATAAPLQVWDLHEALSTALPRLAAELGRSEAELASQAARLAEAHWLSTVGDLRKLDAQDWPRLGLPLKLERALRAYVGT
mmetsp:Transcript_3649/g.10995  ORF Transcript_3649/g.10995 Transcript_3649/m.10995 type:complete len:364 (+) Transcript_3649:1-1092(+)